MGIHKCKASFWTAPSGLPMCSYEVLVDGVKYRCDERELEQLYDGVCPESLDLVEITDSDEETEAYERFEHYWSSRP